MCTAIVRKGRDTVFGFNFDITPGMPYRLYMNEKEFFLGFDIAALTKAAVNAGVIPPFSGSPYLNALDNGILRFEGVSSSGCFGVCLGSQDNRKAPFSTEEGCLSVDALTDRYISGRMSFDDCVSAAARLNITNQPVIPGQTPDFSLHGLLAGPDGRILLAEPGTGYAVIREKYAALTNFDLLEVPRGMCDEKAGYFGKDRYDNAMDALRRSDDSFGVKDALRILASVSLKGDFATRFSFVYSCLEKTVYYTEDSDFGNVRTHTFAG